MKKIIAILLFIPVFVSAQEYTDFLPDVAWRTIIDSVVFKSTDVFTVKVNPLDLSDPGAFEKTVGNFLIDNKRRKYKITSSTPITNGIILTVEDVFKSGAAPYQGLVGYVIESPNGAFASGLSTYFGEKLDPTTEDYEKAIDLRIAYEKGQTIPFDSMRLDTGYTVTGTEPIGTVFYDKIDRTISVVLGNGVIMQVNQEALIKVYNNTPDTLMNGRVVYATGAFDEEAITVDYASKTGRYVNLALTTENIAPNSYGLCVEISGRARGLNTYGLEQKRFYLDTLGNITNEIPEFPYYSYPLGGVIKVDSTDGIIQFRADGINYENSIKDAFDGAVRETFDFRTFSDGINVYGVLSNPTGSDKLTLMFSDGWWDYSVPDTITLTTGTATDPQQSWVFIDKATKTLQSSTSGFPATEHAEVAKITLLDAVNTQTYGALKNQNTNNHLKYDDNNGHIVHLGDRLRVINAQWEDGVSLTVSGTPTNLHLATTSGHVWQLHKQAFVAQNMSTGDDVHIPNHPTTAYFTTTNLNTVTTYSTGTTWNNQWQNLVIWGVANKTGEISHLMVNLASDGYLSESDGIADRNNYTNYTIPREFRGVGFLIARITVRRDPTGYTFNPSTGYLDLRGYYPNNTAGGGTGSSGITEFTQLDDTPSSYIGYGDSAVFVNSSEDGLEFRLIKQTDISGLVDELNTKQDNISLTTTGNSGAASLIGNVLNVPNYTLGGLGYTIPTLQQVLTSGNSSTLGADLDYLEINGIDINDGGLSNVAYLNKANSFTLNQTIINASPRLLLNDNVDNSSGGVDFLKNGVRQWLLFDNNGVFTFANSNSFFNMTLSQSGNLALSSPDALSTSASRVQLWSYESGTPTLKGALFAAASTWSYGNIQPSEFSFLSYKSAGMSFRSILDGRISFRTGAGADAAFLSEVLGLTGSGAYITGLLNVSGATTSNGGFTVSGANNSTNWYTAYNKTPTSIAFTEPTPTTKRLTITRQDGTTLTADFTDNTSGFNYSVQSISGDTITWDASNGVNATLSISDTTYITLSNLSAGMTGNLTVICSATSYPLEFSGTVKVSPYLNANSGKISTTAVASAIDVYSWYYDGTRIIINGTKYYE